MSARAVLRVLVAQTRANFTWYFFRDTEMVFWSLAIPIFFLFVFSFALGGSSTRQTSAFLVPGLIGAQVLSSGFWGVGAMLATFREKKVLRRVYLTPLPSWVFFASLVTYRMSLLAFQALLLALVGSFVFHVHVVGNPLAIAVILVLGAFTFVSLGTVIGAVVRSTESANNIASVLTVPLAFLSDAYIPIDRFPAQIAGVLRALPSTQFIDAFRGIAMYGDSLAHYGAWIGILCLWAIVGTAVSARYFRWV
ncbi:MAG: ABC transporter permease [Candidatus Eremiobacteraeota bacterium]|nr:ABC transporter permease [Candidatus Eremiobacteraeota bacterium]